ncbi:hypothetical protein ACYCJX_06460 [Staphylococcus borealis]|uniref:hypothetical protein n=1 Tax=Staphylococcus borealis TaxID=2742203 RepID=UPI00268B2555
MYKDQNMTQLTLPMETSVLISTNDISRHVNDIVETIPENESDEFRHHRDATLYHPKVDALLESLFIQFHSQCLKQNLIDEQAIFNV